MIVSWETIRANLRKLTLRRTHFLRSDQRDFQMHRPSSFLAIFTFGALVSTAASAQTTGSTSHGPIIVNTPPSVGNGVANGVVKSSGSPSVSNGVANGVVKPAGSPAVGNGIGNGVVKSSTVQQ